MVRRAKKLKKRIPSGKSVIRRGKRKPGYSRCAVCGAKIGGMPRRHPGEIKGVPKSKRVPNRPYGGYLCTKCMRETLKKKSV